MKRIVIILVVIVVFLALGVGLYFFFFNKSVPAGNEPVGGQAGTLPIAAESSSIPSGLPDYIGRAADVIGNLPTSTSIAIGTSQGTVQVANFYSSNPSVIDGGDIVLKQMQNYVIVYDPYSSGFWLGITGTPFATWQTAAEQDFLAMLGINQADACKLDVTSGVIYRTGNPLDGQDFPLSFCSVRIGQ
jgi:hypothetical protein